MTTHSTELHQVRRPHGMPVPEDFAFLEREIPEIPPGSVLVENRYLSVDPYMREEMDADNELHAPMEGRTIGRVVESRADGVAVGDLAFHRAGLRTHAVLPADEVRVLPELDGVPPTAWLGLLGGTGLTAYVGLTRIARIRAGETVFVSAAAGGVGGAAGQFARLLGAGRVIGSAGSAAKVKHLTENLGFDAAFDYHDGPVGEQLARVAPDGIDVYFDNVGGEHLAGAISALRPHGRIAWSGAVAQYNSRTPPAAPENLFDMVEKSLVLQGFLVRDYRDVKGELEEFVVPHIRAGRLVVDQTVLTGVRRLPEALIGMLRGANTGKAIVEVG